MPGHAPAQRADCRGDRLCGRRRQEAVCAARRAAGVACQPVTLVLAALLGLALGSFFNVCIYRLPRGQSIITPPSHCRR
ncbi:prepilin peptidase, partial [candidate division WOR-3 bacterium]|nr:prepilin peptidase [candidate division WOR-3 bacterium]